MVSSQAAAVVWAAGLPCLYAIAAMLRSLGPQGCQTLQRPTSLSVSNHVTCVAAKQ